MKASELKASILQLAVSGKLVLQDPNDEPASALLKRIKKEREQFIKEGKITKGKPLSPVSEEEKPFEIPASWEWVRLGDIIHLISGRDLTPEEYTDKMCGIPYLIGASNVEDGIITVERWTEQPKVISLEDDLLLSCKGTVGKTAIQKLPQAHIARQFMSLRPYFGIDILYFKIFIDNYVPILISQAKSMIPGISREDVLPILCPLPPLAEQHRIVARIEELMPLIEAYDHEEQKLSALEAKLPDALRQSILQYAVQGKLVSQKAEDGTAAELLAKIKKERDALVKEGKIKKSKPLSPVSEEEKPFEIPASWEWVRLGDVVLENIGGGTPSKMNPSYWGGNIKWASVKDLNCDYLSDTFNSITPSGLEDSSSNIIPAGNIIVCTRVGLGKIAINTVDIAINQDLRGLFLSSNIYTKFFINYYHTLSIKGTGMTVKGISVDILHNYLLPLPPLAEQQRIVERVEELMGLCDRIPTHGK